ncbi:hypothetical protein JOM56_009856, partial [Amanita muscaria]
LRRSAHRDLVAEVTAQLEGPKSGRCIAIDTSVVNLRDRSVGWMVRAYQELDNKSLIKKAFQMCRIGEFNCSQESLTSSQALAVLRELPKANPNLHKEISSQEDPVPIGEEEPTFSAHPEPLD